MKFLVCTFACIVLCNVFASSQLTNNADSRFRNGARDLSCSPPQCRLPNVRVTSGTKINQTAPNVAISPRNSANMILGEVDASCKSQGAAYHSSDAGTTWSKTCLPAVGVIDVINRTWMVYDINEVVHAMLGTTNLDCGEDILLETHSSDNGATWSTPTQFSSVQFQFLDSQAMDNFSGGPFFGNIYASSTQFLFQTTQILVWRSTDGGAGWTSSVAASLPFTTFYDGEGYSHLEVGKDGTVYLAYVSSSLGGGSPNEMMFTKSVDGGQTWSTPVQVYSATAVNDLPNTTFYVGDAPVLAVDNSPAGKSRLYMTFYNWTGSFMQVLITHSADGGNTWSTPAPVAPASATNDQFKPYVSVSSTGSVAVTWLDRRDDPSNVTYRPYAAFSRNGIFSKNIALSNASSMPTFGLSYNNSPAANAWTGSTLFSVWPDTRQNGTLQQFVGGENQ